MHYKTYHHHHYFITDCYMGLKPDFEKLVIIFKCRNIVTAQLEISVQITQNVATNLSIKLVLCPLAICYTTLV